MMVELSLTPTKYLNFTLFSEIIRINNLHKTTYSKYYIEKVTINLLEGSYFNKEAT